MSELSHIDLNTIPEHVAIIMDGNGRWAKSHGKDRLFGHSKGVDASKIQNELGWTPSVTFEKGLESTVDWYLSNENWLNDVTSGVYQRYYDEQYST